jgi:hypothetical protein
VTLVALAECNIERGSELQALRPIGKRWRLTTAIIFVGALFLLLSWIDRGDSWRSGMLVNLGTTLLLFGPLFLIERRIEHRLDDVQETQSKVTERQQIIESRQVASEAEMARLTDEMVTARAEFQSAKEALAAELSSRLSKIRDTDRSLFHAIEEQPSRDAIFNGLIRASSMGLISTRGCRIPLGNTNMHVNFHAVEGDPQNPWGDVEDRMEVVLEYVNAENISTILWEQEKSVTDILADPSYRELSGRPGSHSGGDILKSADCT